MKPAPAMTIFMLAIYKKLPKTNCGKCGMPTCMAFAVKVKNAQLRIWDCPYINKEDTEAASRKPTVTLDDNYERVSSELEVAAKHTNFKEAALAAGCHYESGDGKEIISLKMLNKPYEMSKEGLFENGKYCHDSWSKIIIYDYIRRKGDKPLTGEWVTLGYFPNTASHVKAFQRSAEEKAATAFNDDIDKLKAHSKELGGIETSGKMKADFVCRFELLPRYPCIYASGRLMKSFRPAVNCFWTAARRLTST